MRLLLALASRTRSELLDNRWLTDKSRTPMLAQSTSEKCLCEDMVLRLCSRSQFYSCSRLIADFSFASRHDVCRTVNKVFQMALMSLEFVIFPEGHASLCIVTIRMNYCTTRRASIVFDACRGLQMDCDTMEIS